jgi:hypothetical protein
MMTKERMILPERKLIEDLAMGNITKKTPIKM